MRKNTGRQIRHFAAAVLAMGMAAGMTCTAMASSETQPTPVFETEETSIDTANLTQTQDGAIWASVMSEPIKQLKVTLPIRLDFVVYRDSSAAASDQSQLLCGNYGISVDAASEVGVKLDSVTINAPAAGGWSLDTASNVANESSDYKKVSLSIAGKELTTGPNDLSAQDFKVAVGANKTLGLSGQASKARVTAKSAERAFNITYTISQVRE